MSKVILVTGANSGIGYELVRLLAKKPEGHTVYLAARNAFAGEEAQKKLHAEGFKNVKFIQLDVTQPASVHAAKEAIEKQEVGKLDVLVNNAGIAKMEENQNATTVQIDVLRATMETNFFGLVQTTNAFVPLLRKAALGSGSAVILNVSTDMASNAYQARPEAGLHVVAYNTSKAAANSYTIALFHELKKDGIKVNAVTPGFTTSKLNMFTPGGKSLEDGARCLLPFALLDESGPTGKFFDENGKEFAW
ncbi:NAD(P)-binding protein [Agrocybe pediades]|nr:NAD(P)-binding protein [Agrocybe pediades]